MTSVLLEYPFFEHYFAVVAFVFGAIIGSFLNVVIYRFHTGKSLNGSSHCLSCQRHLAWYELLPIVSYVVLRGKCRTCGSYIPVRYVLVESVAALGFLTIYLSGLPLIQMALIAVLFSFLLIIAVYDIYHLVIPNELVLCVCVNVLLLLGVKFIDAFSFRLLFTHIFSGLGASLFFGTLWKISNGRWLGFGDVKLAMPFGLLAGFPGVFSVVVLSFWVGAAVSVLFLALQYIFKRGQIYLRIGGTPLTIKSEVPFAPFLIAGFILSYFFGVDVLSLISHVLPI